MRAALADQTFRAVSEPTRRRILDALAQGEQTVTELCGLFEVTQPAVSQHLKVLRDAGLVQTERRGRAIYYSLDAAPLREVFDWAAHYTQFWNRKLDALAHVLERESKRRPPS